MDVPVRASRTEPGSGDAVKAVSVVGTGTVRIRPEHLYGIGEQDTLTAQLATFGYAPADVDIAILSHLHQDHMGGLPELADTDLLVSADEWGELSRPGPELRGFLRSHIQLPGLRWRQVTMEQANDRNLAPFTQSLDVMGDGSLVLLPTPGHTAGSMSLLVRRTRRPALLLTGDLAYHADLMPRGRLPRCRPPPPARRVHAQRPRARRETPRPGRTARPRPHSRPAAAGQLTPEATMPAF